jgi:hypothetical protein
VLRRLSGWQRIGMKAKGARQNPLSRHRPVERLRVDHVDQDLAKRVSSICCATASTSSPTGNNNVWALTSGFHASVHVT